MGTNPNLSQGQVLTPGQWNALLASKQDNLNFTPLNINGGSMTGPLITTASIAAAAGFNIPPGVAPTSPNPGDIWNTGLNLVVQVAGSGVVLGTTLPFLTINTTPASLSTGLIVNQSYSGAGQPPNIGGQPTAAFNGISITSDNAAITGSGIPSDLAVVHQLGGSATLGGRTGVFAWMIQTAATSASNANRDYVGLQGIGETRSGDGGTNTGSGALGAIFGANVQTRLNGANMFNSCGLEIDSQGTSAGTTKYQFGLTVADGNINRGASWDTAIAIYALGVQSLTGGTFGAGTGWNQVLSLGEVSSSGLSPINGSTTIIGTHLESLSTISGGTGVDFTKIVFAGNAWQSNHFSIAQNGNVSIGANTIGDSIPLSVVNQANGSAVSAVTGTVNNVHVAGADGGNNQLVFDSFGGGNVFLCRRADGSASARTGVVSGETLFNFQVNGWTSAGAYSGLAGAVALRAAEAFGATNWGTQFAVRTTPIGSASIADSFLVDGNGVTMSLADKRVTSDFPVTSGTGLVNVTGLSVNLGSGLTYGFSITLFCTDAAAGGVKAALSSGTLTATNIIYQGYIVDSAAIVGNVQATSLGTAVANGTTTGTTPLIKIEGTITVNVAGNLNVQFAQNTSNGTASTVKQGSFMRVWQMT